MSGLDAPFITIGAHAISYQQALVGALLLLGLAAVAGVVAAVSAGRARREAAQAGAEHTRQLESQLAELTRQQVEMSARVQSMSDVFGRGQSELAHGLREQLAGFGHRLGQNLTTQAEATHKNLSQLNERLAVIDAAQKNLTELSRDVVSLQDILANKQQRGAFGQGRMEAIIADALPDDAFAFQPTLSNRTRPDCLIRLPNDAPDLVVDAKFPLEAFSAFRDAETEPERKAAAQQLRTDVSKHINDIAERYFLPGETQDIALMFVPSESVYADLHEHFDALVQKAYKSRVVIVGPSLLMLAIQVVQAILRDQRMREQAHVIQEEVIKLLEDTGRLRDRVHDLQKHFGQASGDIDKILTSADKISRRGERIEAMEFADETPEELPRAMQRTLAAGE